MQGRNPLKVLGYEQVHSARNVSTVVVFFFLPLSSSSLELRHPRNTSCLYIPGATTVRVLNMATLKLQGLAFASAGFDPLVVFDRIVVVSLQAAGRDSSFFPGPPQDATDGTGASRIIPPETEKQPQASKKRMASCVDVLLGSFRTVVRAWDLETHQLLFAIDISKPSSQRHSSFTDARPFVA